MILKDNEQIAIEEMVNKRQEKEYSLIGNHLKTIDGGKIFEYNLETGEFKEAIFNFPDVYILFGDNNPQLDVNPNCCYVEAINMKNAKKRLLRGDIIFKS